jgi:hypothetical protein
MTNEQILRRYPRWIKALEDVMIGTEGEALSVVRAHLAGIEYACEACNHSGLSSHARVQQAYDLMQQIRRFGRDRADLCVETDKKYPLGDIT